MREIGWVKENVKKKKEIFFNYFALFEMLLTFEGHQDYHGWTVTPQDCKYWFEGDGTEVVE